MNPENPAPVVDRPNQNVMIHVAACVVVLFVLILVLTFAAHQPVTLRGIVIDAVEMLVAAVATWLWARSARASWPWWRTAATFVVAFIACSALALVVV